MDIDKIYLYRMTHIENITHILQNGITHKNSPNTNANFISIGDSSLIDIREKKEILVTNGKNHLTKTKTITLGNYIPFYFGVRMPMLYVIQNGGNFVVKAVSPENIIYMVCIMKKILDVRLTYYFCDGHATDNFTTFYDKKQIKRLPAIINWNAVKMKYWSGEENLNLIREKQAEFIVKQDINTELIAGYVCFNKSAKDKLQVMGIYDKRIKIIKEYYY